MLKKYIYIFILKVYWFIQYAIHWDRTQMLKRISSDKINITKKQKTKHFSLFSFPNMSWDTIFVSLKVCVGISIFNSVFRFSILAQQRQSWKIIDSLILKRHNFFQNQIMEKRHSFLLPDLWFLSYN